MNKKTLKENLYRKYMANTRSKKVVLEDLFAAIDANTEIKQKIETLLVIKRPIKIMVLGSATPDNIDTICNKLRYRNNAKDEVITIDIDRKVVALHLERAKGIKIPLIKIYQADMKAIPIKSDFADFVISDMTINYNKTLSENEITVKEMKRICKQKQQGIILFSVVVDAKYDVFQYGKNQEKVPTERINIPGKFNALPDGSLKRLCWPLPYYKKLLRTVDFSKIIEFDQDEGKTRFNQPGNIVSYRRFCLIKS